jgi:exopolysaccharide production protein ExoQ
LRANPLLVLLLIWVWCSLGWSVDPETSARRALALTAFTAIACWLVVAYEPAALLRRLSWVLMAQLTLSLILALGLPRYAYMPDGHLLRGIFLHKNVLGQVLVFATVLCLLGWELRFLRRTTALGLGLVVLLAGMAGSASATLLVAFVLVLRFVPRILALPGLAATAVMLLLGAIVGAALPTGVLLLEPLLDLLGRDMTFTGRTDLWAYAARMVELRPWLGYGYATFFDLPSVATYVTDMLKWSSPNAHNGYLEVALGLGLVGLALVTFFLLGGVAAALRSLVTAGRHRGERVAASFSLLYLAVYLTRNLVESDLMTQAQLSWTLAVVAVLLARHKVGTTPISSSIISR